MIKTIPPDGTTYKVHASHLARSETLTKLIIANASLSKNETVTVRPALRYYQHFNQYVNWVYYERFATQPPKGPSAQNSGANGDEEQLGYLKSIYLLSVELRDEVFQDAVIDAFVAKIQEPEIVDQIILRADLVREVYERTPHGDQLRMLLAKVFVCRASPVAIRVREFPAAFVLEIACGLMGERKPKAVAVWDREYHVHDYDEPCAMSRKRKRI